MKPKSLKELLSDIDNIGITDIACFACNCDSSNKHELEVIELLEAYIMSIERIEKLRTHAIDECINIVRHSMKDNTERTDFFGYLLKDIIGKMKKLKVRVGCN